jgi:cytoskeletal protein RodZ
MRRWFTLLVFVLALAVPALAQNSSSSSSSSQQSTQQQSQPAQSTGSSSKQTNTTTTTQKSTTPTEVQRTTGVDPLWLAIGGIALITIIAIALLAARSRGRDRTATVRETTVIKE